MKLNRSLLVITGLLVLLLLTGCGLFNNGQVTGTVVYDDDTKAANVDVHLGNKVVKTDAEGAFTFTKVKYDTYEVTAIDANLSQAIKELVVDKKESSIDIVLQAVPEGNLFVNPTFAGPADPMPPAPWVPYGKLEGANTITLVNADDPLTRALHIVDGVSASSGSASQIGLTQTIPAAPGQVYRLSAVIKAAEGHTVSGTYLQLRFLTASGASIATGGAFNYNLSPVDETVYEEFIVEGVAPPEAGQVRVNLWTTYGSTPQFLVRQVALVPIDGVE